MKPPTISTATATLAMVAALTGLAAASAVRRAPPPSPPTWALTTPGPAVKGEAIRNAGLEPTLVSLSGSPLAATGAPGCCAPGCTQYLKPPTWVRRAGPAQPAGRSVAPRRTST
jgi:hypothetical protein